MLSREAADRDGDLQTCCKFAKSDCVRVFNSERFFHQHRKSVLQCRTSECRVRFGRSCNNNGIHSAGDFFETAGHKSRVQTEGAGKFGCHIDSSVHKRENVECRRTEGRA